MQEKNFFNKHCIYVYMCVCMINYLTQNIHKFTYMKLINNKKLINKSKN